MKLPSNIDLDGEWEVALSEISVPSHVHNVIEFVYRQNTSHAGTIETIA